VIGGRSRCDACDAALDPRDLVPIASYLLAGRRCRSCGAPIDPRHVGMEVGAAFIGFVAFFAFAGVPALLTALLGWWLLLVAAIDLDHLWLPDRLTLPLLPLGLAAAWLGYGPTLTDSLVGAAAGFAALALIGWAYRQLRGREGLGGGDPKLLAAIGAWLGWQQLPLVLVGAGFIGFGAIGLRWMKGDSVSATDRLPLGTLMALAAWPLWVVTAG